MRYNLKFYTRFKRISVPRHRVEFNVRFLVKEVAMSRFFLRVCRLSLSIPFYQCSTHTSSSTICSFARGTKRRKVETFIEEGFCGNRRALDRQSLPLSPPVFQNVKLLSVSTCSLLRHVRNSNRRF